MKQIRRFTATIASSAVLAICSLQANAAEPSFQPASDATQPEGQIEFFPGTSSGEISGLFDHAGSIIYFQGHGTTAGKESGDQVTPDKVTIRLEVNGAILDHEFDYAAQTMTINGHGAMLYPDHVQVLRAFYPVLEKGLFEPLLSDQKNTTGEITLARPADALHRIATMYSEVPVGIVLGELKVTSQLDLEVYDTPALTETAPFNTEPLAGNYQEASCQVDSGDGISRYSGAVCTALQVARQDHDASSHCLTGWYEYIGCKESTCKARCGAGCGTRGRGVYTKDCNDHDSCTHYHPDGGHPANPRHNDCGDEFRDAIDDYSFGRSQCRGACR